MLDKLIKKLQTHSGIESKKDIQSAAKTFSHSPFSQLGKSAMLGDDAAVIPKQSGLLLMASEGISPSLVEKEPWFAGWSSVLVNISDIAAMGGKPLALVNSIWSDKNDLEKHNQILSGMNFACEKFNVPMVGGHSNQKSPYSALSVSILGLVDGPILSSRFAESEDELWIIANKDGCFFKDYPFWDAATKASATLLRKHFSLIPFLAKKNIIHAAKDISMGGITGTAVMFAESAGKTIVIDLEKIQRPEGVTEFDWLTCFPSYGFLCAIKPSKVPFLKEALRAYEELICCHVGNFKNGNSSVYIKNSNGAKLLWEEDTPLTGFTHPN